MKPKAITFAPLVFAPVFAPVFAAIFAAAFLPLTDCLAEVDTRPLASPTLTLEAEGKAVSLQNSSAVLFFDEEAPSCLVFAFRMRQMEKQLAEFDVLIEALQRDLRKAKTASPSRRLEIDRLLARRQEVEREARDQKAVWEFEFAWPLEGDWLWVDARNYKLSLDTPSLKWRGFDATEPTTFGIWTSPDGLLVRQTILMADACALGGDAGSYEIRLEKID